MSKEVPPDQLAKELRTEKNKRKRLETKVRDMQKKLRQMEREKAAFNQRIDRLTKENIMLKGKIEGPVGRALCAFFVYWMSWCWLDLYVLVYGIFAKC